MSASSDSKESHGGEKSNSESYFLQALGQAIEKAYFGNVKVNYNSDPQPVGEKISKTVKELFYYAKNQSSVKKDEPQFLTYPQPAGDKIKLHNGTHNFAILYAGNPDKDRHWNNLDRIYEDLLNLNFNENDIYVLYGDKIDTRTKKENKKVDYKATYQNLVSTFATLSSKPKQNHPNSTLFFWVSNHGGFKMNYLLMSQLACLEFSKLTSPSSLFSFMYLRIR